MTQNLHIPDNIAEWIKQHDGVNLSINFNSASTDHGYGHMIWHTVQISIATRTCNRCGYDPLWNPDDSESKCLRHTYGNWRYDTVFTWSEYQNAIPLEEAFLEWVESQPKDSYTPAKVLSFGQTGFR